MGQSSKHPYVPRKVGIAIVKALSLGKIINGLLADIPDSPKRPSLLFQFMRLLIPILTRQIPRWRNLVASIQFPVSKGVEIDVEESADTNTVNVLRRVNLAEIDADAGPAVLAEHLILLFCVEAVVAAAGAAVVMPSNRRGLGINEKITESSTRGAIAVEHLGLGQSGCQGDAELDITAVTAALVSATTLLLFLFLLGHDKQAVGSEE
jgi:hypothetical protein